MHIFQKELLLNQAPELLLLLADVKPMLSELKQQLQPLLRQAKDKQLPTNQVFLSLRYVYTRCTRTSPLSHVLQSTYLQHAHMLLEGSVLLGSQVPAAPQLLHQLVFLSHAQSRGFFRSLSMVCHPKPSTGEVSQGSPRYQATRHHPS